MKTSESLVNLATALSAFQQEIEGAKKTSDNPFYKSKYADLGEIWKTCREPLTKHGLSVVQTNIPGVEGEIIIQTMLLHSSGEYIISDGLNLPLTKKDPQAAGSANTYGRRYSLAAILGIHQEDDDAETHRLPDKNSPLEKLKDKYLTQIRSYHPLDSQIAKIDTCRNETDLKALLLEVKNAFERRQQNNPAPKVDPTPEPAETEETVKAAIVKGWNALKYTLSHQAKSVQKYLGVESLNDCHDIDMLIGYRDHLRAVFAKQKEKEDTQ